MIEKTTEFRNGAEYTNYRLLKIYPALACLGEKRKKIYGYPKITLVKGSYKFGPELQISLASHKDNNIEEENRNATPWNSIEINLKFEDGLELIKYILDDLKKNDS